MTRYLRLSYSISGSSPLYPGTLPIKIEAGKSIKKGNSCNTFLITLSNHMGTHIDAPNHFHEKGRKISDYRIDELIFRRPVVIDCPKTEDEPITPHDLKGKIKKLNDIVLIRTGFYKFRGLKKYTHKNPYILPQTALWLRTEYPNLKALGIDLISAGSCNHNEHSRETHQILLGKKGCKGSPMLIIEDVDLSFDLNGLKEVIAAPLYIEGIDSSPCTLIGVIYG